MLGVLGRDQLARTLLPVGALTKAEVRALAVARGLRTAAKPDSQDVCFVPRAGRRGFLAARTVLTPGTVVDRATGDVLGTVPAVELVTVGQRRGLGAGPDGTPRFVASVDVATATVVVAARDEIGVDQLDLDAASLSWTGVARAAPSEVLVQTSAHGTPASATLHAEPPLRLSLHHRIRPVAPGQLAVLYDPADPDVVLGAATVARRASVTA